MTISKVMGIASPSKVLGVSNASIGSVMGVSNAPPFSGLLIEGFEVVNGNGVPTTGPWNQTSMGTGVVLAQSTTDVTQGTYSSQWTDTQTGFGANRVLENFGNYIDLTGYTTLKLDVTIVTNNNPANTFGLFVADSSFTYFVGPETPAGATGTFTLTADLTLILSGINACYIEMGVYNAYTHDMVAYVDFLRAE